MIDAISSGHSKCDKHVCSAILNQIRWTRILAYGTSIVRFSFQTNTTSWYCSCVNLTSGFCCLCVLLFFCTFSMCMCAVGVEFLFHLCLCQAELIYGLENMNCCALCNKQFRLWKMRAFLFSNQQEKKLSAKILNYLKSAYGTNMDLKS